VGPSDPPRFRLSGSKMPRSIEPGQIQAYLRSFGRFQRDARLYLISSALSGVTIGIIQVLYNLYLAALGYNTDFIGLLLSMGTIGAGLAIFPAGACVDRFGGKLVLIWSSVLIGVAGAGQILFHTPIPLLLSTFVVGIGGAFILVVNAPFLTAHSTSEERPHLFSLNLVVTLGTTVLGQFIGGALPHWLLALPWLGGKLSPSLAWLLVPDPQARSYQLALLLAGIIAAPSFVPLFLLRDDRPTSPAPLSVLPRLRWPFFRWKVSTTASANADPSQTSLSPATWWARLGLSVFNFRVVCRSPLLALVMVQVLIGLGAGLFLPYFNLYFVRYLGASSTLFGIIDGSASLLTSLLLLLAPWLALRVGRVTTILVTRLLALPVLLLIALSSYLPLAAALYPLRQGLMNMSEGILQVFSMEAVAREHRGLANSSYQVAEQVARACTVPLGGLIIECLGFPPVFLGAACLYTLAFLLFWLRFGRGQDGELERMRKDREDVDEANKEVSSIS
jgi:MFS family permease